MVRIVSDLLGDRALFWFGTRGTDAQPLLALDQFAGVFSMVAPLGSAASDLTECCLETLSKRRVDLNAYSIDDDRTAPVSELYQAIVRGIHRPTVVAAYRPSDFLASVHYPKQGLVDYAGLFHTRQIAFEHKAWVETELSKIGVRTIPWEYYADYARADLERDVSRRASSVVRANASDGGRGLTLVHRGARELRLPKHTDHFLAVAPYLSPSIPLNVGCCVYADGSLTLHGPSVQLIGIPECVNSDSFGYCGNDFAAPASMLDRAAIDDLEGMARRVGAWMAQNGYVGAFGVDALLFEGDVYLTEVNPRFQGSSSASADLDDELGRANIYLHHLAASLGDAAPSADTVSLAELVEAQAAEDAATSNVVCYNTTGEPVRLLAEQAPDQLTANATILALPEPDIWIEPQGMLLKMRVRSGVTKDGYSLDPLTSEQVVAWASAFDSLQMQAQA